LKKLKVDGMSRNIKFPSLSKINSYKRNKRKLRKKQKEANARDKDEKKVN
jgi:hypothetical protein